MSTSFHGKNTHQKKKYDCSSKFFYGTVFSINNLTVKLYCSSKSKIPVWPFLVLSCIGGAYALIPYFVLWKPPPPPIDEDEIGQWPLKFVESKLTAGVRFSFTSLRFTLYWVIIDYFFQIILQVVFALGIGLIIYAGKAGGDDWKEFIRYFRESKFVSSAAWFSLEWKSITNVMAYSKVNCCTIDFHIFTYILDIHQF